MFPLCIGKAVTIIANSLIGLGNNLDLRRCSKSIVTVSYLLTDFRWMIGTPLLHSKYNVMEELGTHELIYKLALSSTRLLFHYYSNSPCQALQAIYPKHKWLSWKFAGVSQDVEKHRKFLDWMAQKLNLKKV